jgi:hypothetical protein
MQKTGLRILAILAVPLMLSSLACQQPQSSPVSQTAPDKPVSPASLSPKPAADKPLPVAPNAPKKVAAEPAFPTLPEWLIIREIPKPLSKVICKARWTGGNRIEINTDNVHRLTLDLTKLPPGAEMQGPWNLQIDHQGIAITGRRGLIIELIQSRNGDWSVDFDRMPSPR